MNWEERRQLQQKAEAFDRIASKMSYLKLASSDLGTESGWNFTIKTNRIPEGGKITAPELSKESVKRIREIIQKDIESQLEKLREALNEI